MAVRAVDSTISLLKKCAGPCGRTLPATTEFFYAARERRDGLRRLCKECSRAEAKEHHRRFPAGKREQKRPRRKVCSKCGVEKPFTKRYFYVSARSPGGRYRLDSWCKECRKAVVNRIYWENPEEKRRRVNEARARARDLDPDGFAQKEMARRARHNAKLTDEEKLRKRQDNRITARLRGDVESGIRRRAADVEDENRRARTLPNRGGLYLDDPEPVRRFLRILVEQNPEGRVGVARLLGMDEARVRRLMTGDSGTVISVDLADRIFTRAGRPDLYGVFYGDIPLDAAVAA